MQHLDWKEDAPCLSIGTEMFYPPEAQPIDPRVRRVCHTCPVRVECAIVGLSEEHGWWGGVAPSTRRDWRRDLRIRDLLGTARMNQHEAYVPWLRQVFKDAARDGLVVGFVSNMPDRLAARRWISQFATVKSAA